MTKTAAVADPDDALDLDDGPDIPDTTEPKAERSPDLVAAEQAPAEHDTDAPLAVTFGGETFHLGRMPLARWTAATRVLVAAIARMRYDARRRLMQAYGVPTREELEQLSPAEIEERTESLRIFRLEATLDAFDDDTVARLFGVVLDRSPQWVTEHFDVGGALDVVEAVLRQNDVSRFVALFRELTGAL